jgi:hypothetical protein
LDLDSIYPVDSMSDLTVQTLVDRIARSRTEEQFVYRETELDELWRLVDIAIRAGTDESGRGEERLRQMRDSVHRAHDLIGMDAKPLEAAAALREALI